MNFRVLGLDYAPFAPYFSLTDAQLAARGARRQVADRARHGGMPCRVSLRDAMDGERVILLNYEHLAVDTPYRSRYAIYVRESANAAQLEPGAIPEVMRTRPLSLRAFSAAGMLLDAALAQGPTVAPTIERLLANGAVEFLHVHNAAHGCYSARVERCK